MMKMVQMKMKMKMNNLNKIYEGILGEQAQPAGSEDNRKAALGTLALYAKRQTKVQEYEATVRNLWDALERVEDVSQDPELVAYAQELFDNQDNLNPQDQKVYDTFCDFARNGDYFDPTIIDLNADNDLSPLNHIETGEYEDVEGGIQWH